MAIDESAKIILDAIGVVRNELKEPKRGPDVQKIVTEIELDASLSDALDYLDEFSHIMLLYWARKGESQELKTLRIRPHNDPEAPMAGIFATFTPDRPNPVGVSIARIVERNGNILKVSGLGIVDGTSVIDIKPYIPRVFSIPDAKVASWINRPRRP
ncbi:MAG: tRNA (N6-threonylcarbamoyladenosine(37)-N6)-methyltransferase TrmO [Deltaproteobacteria bacterium]|nr:tRNA (N6-threonylcarbamoyladenosine(37)-N6)-methyltransferase TrmO [Deltaproteobacteria bacterium]